MSNTHDRRRGAAAIEFALVLPVLLAILFGIIEYGWIFFQQSNILAAAREGARYGVTFQQGGSPTPASAAQSRAMSTLSSYGISTASATVSASQSGASPEEVLTVNVVVSYTPIIGLVPTPANLNGQMTMLLELQD